MAFMDKNVNFILVLAIIIILLGMVGATLFFQNNYDELVTKYRDKEKQVNQLELQMRLLANLSSNLNRTLESKTTDISDLSQQYLTEKTVKEELSTELEDTQSELDDTTNILANTKSELATTKQTLTTAQTALSTANNNVKTLNETLNVYLIYIPSVRDDINDLEDYLDAVMADENATISDYVDYIDEIDDLNKAISTSFEHIEEANE